MKCGCILCGGVGSGKSFTSVAYYYIFCGGSKAALLNGKYTRMTSPKNLYIITTAKKRDSLEWEGELSPFLLSTKKETCSYDINVVVDSWNNIKKYKDITDSFFIFDEDKVTGYGAWVKAFLKITKSNHWIILSATPGDTWMDYIPVFIANGFYKYKSEFEREHVVWAKFTNFPKVSRYTNTRRLERLRNSILVTMDFNRDTIQHHENIWSNYDIFKYKDAGKRRWDPYEDKPIETAGKLCLIWRRIVNEDPSKVEELLKIYKLHHRIIVFYNFDYELDILKNAKYSEAIGEEVEIAEWNGHKHQPIPDCNNWVYLVHYNAGAEGWNCIKTDTIIFFSESYSYKNMVQASGRIDRLNTPYIDLFYYHIKSKAPIDIAIERALKNKKDFNERKFVNW